MLHRKVLTKASNTYYTDARVKNLKGIFTKMFFTSHLMNALQFFVIFHKLSDKEFSKFMGISIK